MKIAALQAEVSRFREKELELTMFAPKEQRETYT